MTRALYLLALAISWAGVLVLDRRLGFGVAGRPLIRSVAVTVPLFLAFDAVGAARGWFASSPARNVLIVPPGIALEEPVLLAFLCAFSVLLWRAAARVVAVRRAVRPARLAGRARRW